jgi:hypothetical protein
MLSRSLRAIRSSPKASAAAGALLLAVPLSGLALIVHGTSTGKIFRCNAETFLLREFNAMVSSEELAALRAEALALMAKGAAVRYNFAPGKAGAAVSYAALQQASPLFCAFYEGMAARVSERLALELKPTPANDNSSLSLLVYLRDGDHIDWHYDLNFYRGRHFTVLVPLIVEGPVDAQLQAAVPKGARIAWTPDAAPPVHHASASQETVAALLGERFARDSGNAFPGASVEAVATRVGAVVAFEGARVFHRVTPLGARAQPWRSSWEPPASAANGTREGVALEERARAGARGEGSEQPLRVVLSMTFTTDASAGWLSTYQRRLKDITYFGPLAALFG